MRFLFYLILLVTTLLAPASPVLFGQSVGINTPSPHPSAALDVTSTSRGVLAPRMTNAQRDAISSPAEGLIVYNTETHCLNMWNGSKWIEFCASSAPCVSPPTPAPGVNTPICAGQAINFTSTTITGATYVWTGPNNFYSTAQNPTIASAAAAHAGTYVLRAWAGGCYSKDTSITISVTPSPWVRKADFPGATRNGMFGFSIGALGYMGGGRQVWNSGTAYQDVYYYDPSANTWTRVADYPLAPRWYPIGFTTSGMGYVVGGFDGSAWYNQTHQYNPGTNTWTAKAASYGGTLRSEANAAGVGTSGYAGVGKNSCFYQDWFRYTPGTDTWTSIGNMPGGPRGSAFAFEMGGKLYVGTGSTWSCGTTSLSDFYEYDPTANTWTTLASYPGPSGSSTVAFSIGTTVYAISGTKVMYSYDRTSNTWTRICDFPASAAAGPSPATAVCHVSGGKAYIFNATTKETWEFTP